MDDNHISNFYFIHIIFFEGDNEENRIAVPKVLSPMLNVTLFYYLPPYL